MFSFLKRPTPTNRTPPPAPAHEIPRLSFEPSLLQEELDSIREYSKAVDKFSWTSDDYQNAIVNRLMKSDGDGRCVIEIGSFRGGLSAQLAYIARIKNLSFFFIDIDINSISSTMSILDDLGLTANTGSFHGTFQSFSEAVLPKSTPSMIVVDGDHEYQATKKDINTILSMPAHPECVVFHDFSLRSDHTEENVQKAVEEMLPNAKVIPVGLRFNGSNHATRDNPQEDGHYWESPGSEGALVDLTP